MLIWGHKEWVVMAEDGKKSAGKLKDVVIPRGPKSIAEPEKELRFTRGAQAMTFFALAVVVFALTLALFILSTQDWGMEEPLLTGWWWVCFPGLFSCYALFWLGLYCNRHAYIILSPLGVEVFPFLKASQNLRVVYWSQVADVEFPVGDNQMVLHFTEEKKSGIIASLKPIPGKKRHLLEKAVQGVLEKRD